MAHAKTEDSIHVRLDRPIDKRKAILQTTIDVIELLKREKSVREIRKEKVKAMEDLKLTLADIKKLYRAIKLKDMPIGSKGLMEVKNVGGQRIIAPASVPKPKRSRKKATTVAHRKSAIDRQLDALRRKLETL